MLRRLHQQPPRMRVALFGDLPVIAVWSRLLRRRIQSQVRTQLLGVRKARNVSNGCQAGLRHRVVDTRNAHHQPYFFVLPGLAHQSLLEFSDFQFRLLEQAQVAVSRLGLFFSQRQLAQPSDSFFAGTARIPAAAPTRDAEWNASGFSNACDHSPAPLAGGSAAASTGFPHLVATPAANNRSAATRPAKSKSPAPIPDAETLASTLFLP